MPRYDFYCEECGIFEAFQRDPAYAVCPTCSGNAYRSYTSSPAVLVRPAGYSLKPDDKGYWNIKDKEKPPSWAVKP